MATFDRVERLKISVKEASRIANEIWGGVYLVRRVKGGFEVLLHSATGPRYLLDDFGVEVKKPQWPNPRGRRTLSVPDQHLLRIAHDNFKNPAKARFLGGPTPEQSRAIITRLTGRDPGPPPTDPRLKNPDSFFKGIKPSELKSLIAHHKAATPTRVRVGRKMVPLSEATLSQLQVAALKAFPSSPYQLEIRAEINRRHERGEKTWMPPEKKRRRRNPELKDVRSVGSNMTEAHHGLLHILYSYKTPVAILAPSGLYKTAKFHSRTTSGHIAKWFRSWNLDPKGAGEIGQDEIERCAENGIDPQQVVRSRNPRSLNPVEKAWKYIMRLKGAERTYAEKVLAQWTLIGRVSTLPSHQVPFNLGTKIRYEIEEQLKEILGGYSQRNPRRRTGRTLKRKKIASSYKRQRYEFFRKPSHGGLEKPAATAQHAKKLADAERWAYDQGVDYLYYYGADAGYEDEGDEWQGRVEAVHPNGMTADAYGYLGDDWNQAHVRAEAALALMHDFKNYKVRNPARGGHKVVRIRKRARVTVRGGLRRKENPAIGILGNPPHDGKYLGKVTYIEYTHGHDGQRYYHDFKPAVYAQVMDDGGVRLWHPTNKLWKLFPEPK